MTVDIESRLRSDLARLADQLENAGNSDYAEPDGSPRGFSASERRSWLPAVACVVFAVGLFGALAIANARRDNEPEIRSGSEPTAQPTIAVSMFSGIRDPVWQPTDTEHDQLSELLDKLPTSESSNDPTANDNLGFRGFSLIGLRVDKYGEATVEVRRGGVVVNRVDGSKVILDDPQNDLMRTLFELSLTHLDEGTGRALKEGYDAEMSRSLTVQGFDLTYVMVGGPYKLRRSRPADAGRICDRQCQAAGT